MSPPPDAPATAAPSATMMLVRQRGDIEVLMVERGQSAVFGAALVFPGGKVDAADDSAAWRALSDGGEALDTTAHALRVAGWREVYEETGLLPDGQAVSRVADRQVPFIDILRQRGLRLPLHHTHHFAHWITPSRAPRRFDTHFFIAAIEGGDAVVCDGGETVSAEWLPLRHVLDPARHGPRQLLFSTRSQLRRIAHCTTLDEVFATAAAHPVVPIEPRPEQRGDRLFISIPTGLGYTVCEEDITELRMTPGPPPQANRAGEDEK